jgi:hypothetical protein
LNYYSVLESASQKSGEEVEISDHAYIPYKYAHNCIAKIMEDMKNMKVTHVENNMTKICDSTENNRTRIFVTVQKIIGLRYL